MDDFPEWAGRAVLAEALRAAGLPWVPWAAWRRPPDTMTYRRRLQAVALSGRVLDEARRRLPPGVSGAALGAGWRDAAWRCVVAGIALLDDAALARLVGQRHEDHVERVEPVSVMKSPARHEPAVATVRPAAPAVKFRIYREGEVPHVS